MGHFVEQLLDGVETAESAELVDQGAVCGLRMDEVGDGGGPSEVFQCLGSRFLVQYQLRNMLLAWCRG